MLPAFLSILPILLIFGIGYFLKAKKYFQPSDADLFLKLNFLVGAPALVLLSMSSIELTAELLLIPAIAITIVLTTFAVSWLVGKKWLNFDNKALGVLMVGTMIINTGFTIPFIVSAYGEEGLARIILFDFGSEIIGVTLAYFLACRYGDKTQSVATSLKKVFFSPLFIALVLGLTLNLLQIQMPEFIKVTLALLGAILIPLVVLSLGMRFSLKIANVKGVMAGIIIRMLLGLGLGLLLAWICQLAGLSLAVTVIAAASPIGYMTLTFASMEKLDEEYAASLVSFSILIGLIVTPLLILIANSMLGL